MGNYKRYYLCSNKGKKEAYKKKIRMKRNCLLVDYLYDAEKVLVVGEMDKSMEKEVIAAKKAGIGIERVSESELESMGRHGWKDREEEPRFAERERSQGYEL